MARVIETADPDKSASIRALSPLNFFLADVQNGMGPYVTLWPSS